jgi:hypothetical protein
MSKQEERVGAAGYRWPVDLSLEPLRIGGGEKPGQAVMIHCAGPHQVFIVRNEPLKDRANDITALRWG